MNRLVFPTVVPAIACQITCSNVPSTIQLPEIVKIYRKCSLTYLHPPPSTFQATNEYGYQFATKTIPKLKTIFGENVLQCKVSTSPNPIKSHGNLISGYKFSLCTVLMLFVEHVELSLEVIHHSNAPEDRPEFTDNLYLASISERGYMIWPNPCVCLLVRLSPRILLNGCKFRFIDRCAMQPAGANGTSWDFILMLTNFN